MKNMKEAVELFHEIMEMDKSKIGIKIDCDCDGFVSSSLITDFIKILSKNAEIEHIFSYNKEHGLTYKMISEYINDYFDLIIIPDASMEVSDAKQIIRNNPNTKILVLDHHNIEIDKETGDCYINYCVAVNCKDEQYPNNTLSGVGVVMKFCEAYCRTYNIDESILNEWMDLVSTGIICDGMSLKENETRYYVYEGLKKENFKNDFLNELQERRKEEFSFSRNPMNVGWNLGPLINGVVRYGKNSEQRDMFRAMIGEQEEIEYQPRRKSIKDPKPPIEIHTLQWDMARTAVNVKQRQDNAVRAFMEEIEKKIETEDLNKNSILFINTTDIVDKKTVSGLCANKLASIYHKPVVLLRDKNSSEFGGSGRNYSQSGIENLNEFLSEAGIDCRGHNDAFGISLPKKSLSDVIKYCNENYSPPSKDFIYPVSWEIPAKELRKEYVEQVGQAYELWGNDIEQPTFAITGLEINASLIQAYGDNNNFIRFVYNDIPFIKKYCPHGDYEAMTMKTRKTLGKSKKNLVLNIIGQFILNTWEDKISAQVKILAYDVRENKEDVIDRTVKESVKGIKKEEKREEKDGSLKKKEIKKVQKKVIEDDDDFVF